MRENLKMRFCFIEKTIRAIDRLNLAMLWNRADIARSKIFVGRVEWQVKGSYFKLNKHIFRIFWQLLVIFFVNASLRLKRSTELIVLNNSEVSLMTSALLMLRPAEFLMWTVPKLSNADQVPAQWIFYFKKCFWHCR